MKINVGALDRRIRLVAGIVLLLLPFLGGFESTLAKGLCVMAALVLLVTAAMNRCPAYSLLGVDTSSK